MGVGHGDAYGLAAVFKEEDVLDLLVGAHVVEALQPEVGQLVDVVVGEVLQEGVVLVGVEDHLAAAVGGAHLKEAAGHIVGLGGILHQGGEIVGVAEDVKALVRHFSGAGAEGTPVLGHLGPGLAVGGHHDPVLGDGIIAKFSHFIRLLFF